MIKTTMDQLSDSKRLIESIEADGNFSKTFSDAHNGHRDENITDHSNVEEDFKFPSKSNGKLKFQTPNEDLKPETNPGVEIKLQPGPMETLEFSTEISAELKFQVEPDEQVKFKIEQDKEMKFQIEPDEELKFQIEPDEELKFKTEPHKELKFQTEPVKNFRTELDKELKTEPDEESKSKSEPVEKLKFKTEPGKKMFNTEAVREVKFKTEPDIEMKLKQNHDEDLIFQSDLELKREAGQELENGGPGQEFQPQQEVELIQSELYKEICIPEGAQNVNLVTESICNGKVKFQTESDEFNFLAGPEPDELNSLTEPDGENFQQELKLKKVPEPDRELEFPAELEQEFKFQSECQNVKCISQSNVDEKSQPESEEELKILAVEVQDELAFRSDQDEGLKSLSEPYEEFQFQPELKFKSEPEEEVEFIFQPKADEIELPPNPNEELMFQTEQSEELLSETEVAQDLKFHLELDKELESQPIDELVKPNDGPFHWSTLDEEWNVFDLCTQVLSTALNTLPADEHPIYEDVTDYLQKVFHTDDETHGQIFLAANDVMLPKLILYVEVVEAKGLHGKDANGLSDPLCSLYFQSSPKKKVNTSMKPETLTPSWEEHFSFPIVSIDDVFNLDIWDYDPPESVTKKLKRIKEVKSAKGFKILMKDIVTTKSIKKQQKQNVNDFMGCAKIPLKSIPSKGLEKWFQLEGKSENSPKGDPGGSTVRKSNKGEILLRFKLGADKDKMAAAEEYRRAYHLMVLHELCEQKIPPNEWNGEFKNKLAEFVLHQLEWQSGLTPKQFDLAKWFVHTRIHSAHRLHASVFPWIFQNVTDVLDTELRSELEVQKFWLTTKKLVEDYAEGLMSIHDIFQNNPKFLVQINYQLKTLGLIKDYLSSNPIPDGGEESVSKFNAEFITEKLQEAILKGAHELYANASRSEPNSSETEIENMMRIGKLLNADLQSRLESVQNFFKRFLGIDFLEITYRVYDKEFGQIVSPVIEDVCKDLKRLDLKEAEGGSVEEDMSTGTTMFALYQTVRQFADFSSHLTSHDDLLIAGGFHRWFYASVAQWLDMAFYKGVSRIKKAVELDTLKAIDKYVQRSSSAVDTAHAFHQIQEFWAKLAWPEVEGSYTFIAKILDELCRCNVLYSQILFKKLEHVERKRRGDKYEISDELCSAMNNIEYLGQEMLSLSESLGTEKILTGLIALKGESIGAQCKRTLETVIENSEESINDKLYGLLVELGEKVRPPIERLLKKAVESAKEEEGIQKLMTYMDDMLIKLKTRTSEGSFEKIFHMISETTSTALEDLSRKSIEKKKHPEYFCRILTIHHVMVRFFHPEDSKAAKVKETGQAKILFDLLETHAASTPELIMKYQQGRHEYQNTLPPKPGEWGMLTVRAQYCVDIRTLNVEVLNARNLRATDSNGSSDPFVKVRVVPKPMYGTISRFKTKVMKETLFPLFDECFSMELSADDMAIAGFIQFVVYDHDVVGKNDFLGETFYPLASVPVTKSDTELKDIPQKNLVLHNPKDFEHPALKIMESRKKDKIAFKFVKKEKSKTIPEPVEA